MTHHKRSVERAAELCAMAANETARFAYGVSDVCDDIGIDRDDPSRELALDAVYDSLGLRRAETKAELYAEAEAMIRTGWLPDHKRSGGG